MQKKLKKKLKNKCHINNNNNYNYSNYKFSIKNNIKNQSPNYTIIQIYFFILLKRK